MSQETATPVTVQILDKEYRISCSQPERPGLLESARVLDQRMREVRQSGRVHGPDRVAVMAALNLIYELINERDQQALAASRLEGLQKRVSQVVGAESEPPTS